MFRDDTTGSHLVILRENQSWRREMLAVSQANLFLTNLSENVKNTKPPKILDKL